MPAFDTVSILIGEFLDRLELTYRRIYGKTRNDHVNTLRTCGMMALEIIANSDALYHDVEHSIMVSLVGQDILRGRQLRDGDVSPSDWVNFIVSLLCHDIGYVRGICPGDDGDDAVIDGEGKTVAIPPGATDAFLTPYHVERGKMFVRWRFREHPVVDPGVVAANIEHTRFPVPAATDSRETADYPGLVRAADLIGQLADPDYRRKLPALFYEFEETGANRRIGYNSPQDLHDSYPEFYWKMVSRHVGVGLDYLRVTRQGRHWQASLYSHIFCEEHPQAL